MMEDRNENEAEEMVDALCRECGHAFKVYVDRVLSEGEKNRSEASMECPVCGCGECRIGKPAL